MGDGPNYCYPPSNITRSGYVNRTNVVDQNLKMVGVLKEHGPDALVLKYEDSNVFWDESDIFASEGQDVRVYRAAGDDQFKEGDKLLIEVGTRVYDSTKLYEVGECEWSGRYLEASSIQKYHGDPSIWSAHIAHNFLGTIALVVLVGIVVGTARLLQMLYRAVRK